MAKNTKKNNAMFDYSKDRITVATILDTRRQKNNDLYPVRIRVTYRRKVQYYPTGKDLTPEQWDALPKTRSSELKDLRDSINNSFEIVRKEVQELAYMGGFSFDALNERLKAGVSSTVNTAFRAKINYLRKNSHIGNMSVYDNVLKGIERFKGKNITFESITVEWLRQYERFLLDENKTASTIGIHFRTIRAIMNEAKRAGKIKETQYPFGRGKYQIQAGEGRKMALTLDQIGQIARYDDGTSATAKYRDYWIFLYLCNGINVADFVKLRYRDIKDGEIYFIRQKTEHTLRKQKDIRVIVTDPMQRIIDTWGNPKSHDNFIFPILNGKETALEQKKKTQYLTRAINKRMKSIAKNLGIDHISTYTARHSFATVLKRSGASIAYISEALGHQDLKTTENYLASFEREKREKAAELLTKF